MHLSRCFLRVIRDTPKEAEIVSHQLMLRAGMVRQASAGIYSWLPLGLRVLNKIADIVREEQNRAGAIEVLMPTIQSADLWKQSGRYEDYGKEMLRIEDRHEREMLYGPTNEELITTIFRDGARSYRDLPRNLYHIQWKFRDEIRPRFGVMRGREFLMKDAYSFDLTEDEGRRSYNRMFASYLRIFARMGLQSIPMAAETGPIGGDLSHEFIILADTGESAVFCHKDLLDGDIPPIDLDYDGDLTPIVDQWTSLYAATDEIHDAAKFAAEVPKEKQVSAFATSILLTITYGSKYSEPLNCKVQGPDGNPVALQMGSYGVGVSRLVGGIIEACHDDNGIVWPVPVAPFEVGLINLKSGDAATDGVCETLYQRLNNAGIEVLYDDTGERAGAKFASMDLIGLPYQLVIGPKGAAAGMAELKDRKTGDKQEIPIDSIADTLIDRIESQRVLC